MSYILAIETSCDETAAAVLKDGRQVLSSIVGFQWDIHRRHGGVVPELACRRHIEIIYPITEEAIKKAGITLKNLDAIAVTSGPGLIGALLVGVSFAKALSYSLNVPLVSVNHLEGHLWAISLEKRISKPFIGLVVSGGHTNIYLVEDIGKYKLLGSTLDDAAGEAFDKVAKLLGLGYPGGVVIDRLAKTGDPSKIEFTRPYISKDSLDFSFSGIKTAALHWVKGHGSRVRGQGENKLASCPLPLAPVLNDLAAGFQEAVVDVLTEKAVSACRANNVSDLVVSGGVACNSRLREKLMAKARDNGIRPFLPDAGLCSDNGAMIAATAYHLLKKGSRGGLDMNAMPNL